MSDSDSLSKSPPGNLECPRCKEKLSLHTLEGMAVRVCNLCGGLWIGSQEFREALKKPPPHGSQDMETGVLETALWEESRLPCPDCGLPMSKGRYAYSSGVTIDRCQSCGGVWLDRGELARLRVFVSRPVSQDRVLLAQMQAEILKKRATARELSEARDSAGGTSLGQILKLLKDLLS